MKIRPCCDRESCPNCYGYGTARVADIGECPDCMGVLWYDSTSEEAEGASAYCPACGKAVRDDRPPAYGCYIIREGKRSSVVMGPADAKDGGRELICQTFGINHFRKASLIARLLNRTEPMEDL